MITRDISLGRGKGGRGVELTTFAPTYPDYLEISDALTCWNPRAPPGLRTYCFTFTFTLFDWPRRGLEGNMNINLEDLGYEDVKCIYALHRIVNFRFSNIS